MKTKQTYRFKQLSAMEQFHILRRSSGLFTQGLSFVMNAQKSGFNPETEATNEDFLKMVKDAEEFLAALSKLSDEDSEYVILGLLKGADIHLNGLWSPVVSGNIVTVDFVKNDLMEMAAVCLGVIKANSKGFFTALSTDN